MLAELEQNVVEAASGEDALRFLLREECAVILLDANMPGLDGYTTAELIRRRERSRHIPIIFVSAIDRDDEHIARAYAMGAVDYVFKPVDPVILRSKVSVLVDLYLKNEEVQRKARSNVCCRKRTCASGRRSSKPSGSCGRSKSGRPRSCARCRSRCTARD